MALCPTVLKVLTHETPAPVEFHAAADTIWTAAQNNDARFLGNLGQLKLRLLTMTSDVDDWSWNESDLEVLN